jgi:hypothetical protein
LLAAAKYINGGTFMLDWLLVFPYGEQSDADKAMAEIERGNEFILQANESLERTDCP